MFNDLLTRNGFVHFCTTEVCDLTIIYFKGLQYQLYHSKARIAEHKITEKVRVAILCELCEVTFQNQ